MLTRSRIIGLMLLAAIGSVAHLNAQVTDKGWKNFQFLKHSNAWLTSYNASGLKFLPIEKLSIAEVYATKGKGDFINYYQSSNSLELGALTESFYRLNPKVVFYGKVNYSNFTGKNMAGSAFINPYNNPIDIVEYETGNEGKKKLENYNLVGAVSGELYKGFAIGGKIDYTAANYAKEKDLRHKNKLFDMVATAGISYQFGPLLNVGSNYYYRRGTEGVEFNMYGTTDKKYFSLVSYGAFSGLLEEFGGSIGLTKKGEEKPMVNEYHGASLQVNLNLCVFTFYNEFTYKARDGYYGKRSPSSVVYTEHNSDIMEYTGVLSYKQGRNLHALRVNADYEKLNNFENVYQEEKQPAGNTEVIYYDELKTTERKARNIRAEYTGNLGISDFNPAWVIKAGMDYHSREQLSAMYPYYRKQKLHYSNFSLSVNHNLVKGKEMYSFYAGARYGSGGGTAKDDRTYATPSALQTPPAEADHYLQREYEYLTNNRLGGEVAFKYSRLLAETGIRGYAAVEYSFTKASDIVHLSGDKFNRLKVTVGCSF